MSTEIRFRVNNDLKAHVKQLKTELIPSESLETFCEGLFHLGIKYLQDSINQGKSIIIIKSPSEKSRKIIFEEK